MALPTHSAKLCETICGIWTLRKTVLFRRMPQPMIKDTKPPFETKFQASQIQLPCRNSAFGKQNHRPALYMSLHSSCDFLNSTSDIIFVVVNSSSRYHVCEIGIRRKRIVNHSPRKRIKPPHHQSILPLLSSSKIVPYLSNSRLSVSLFLLHPPPPPSPSPSPPPPHPPPQYFSLLKLSPLFLAS